MCTFTFKSDGTIVEFTTFTTLWTNSADKLIFLLFFSRNLDLTFHAKCLLLSIGGNLHEMSNPVFWD